LLNIRKLKLAATFNKLVFTQPLKKRGTLKTELNSPFSLKSKIPLAGRRGCPLDSFGGDEFLYLTNNIHTASLGRGKKRKKISALV